MSPATTLLRRRKRGLLIAGFVVVAVAAAWSPVCLWRAGLAGYQRDVRSQEWWLAAAGFLPWPRGELAFQQARLARQLGRPEEFASAMREAQAAGYSSDGLRRELILQQAQVGELKPLEQHLGEWLLEGEDLPAICEAYVSGCIQQYRIPEAHQVLDLWQKDFPDDPQPRFLRGRLFEHQYDLERAQAEFSQALEIAPRYAPAAFNLGRILVSRQQLEPALRAYRQAAALLAEPQPALVGIARCQRGLGDPAAARTTMEHALARPSDQLEDAYRYVGERSETALAQAPAEMAQLEIEAGNDAAAVKWLEQALQAYPQDWKLRYTYSTTLQRLGRQEDAEQEAQQSDRSRVAMESCDRLFDALGKNPADVEARYHIGCVLLEHLSTNQGLVWLNSVLTFDPQHRPTHARLAEYFAAHASDHPDYPRLAEEHRRAAAEPASPPAP
ncbi:MAG: hypothetical protein SFV23_15145 [Planctomycetaceae bacterium]|nr:hypothetical protein [Planctomycetaceae bacterium]